MTTRRRQRPAALDYAVYVVAGFLALFLVYEGAKRRVKPAAPAPAPASAAAMRHFSPPAGFVPPPAAVYVPPAPPERGGRGPVPEIAVDRVEKRRPPRAVPAPR